MPNLNNFKEKPLTKDNRSNFLNVRREDVFFREDVRASFGYTLVGVTVSLAIIGGVYVIGKQLLK
jgi:hypothetical protein